MADDVFSRLRLNGKNLAMKTIKNKIEQFISSGIYHDLEEFIADNPDLTTFQNHTRLNNTLRKVWGYQITDQEYQEILDVLKKEVEERMKIDTDKVKTVSANGKEITTYEGQDGTMVLDNSYAHKSIEEQLPDLQKEHQQFQTGGAEGNIEAMMGYMQEEIKPEVTFATVDAAQNNALSQEEREKLEVARQYEKQTDKETTVDPKNGLIMQDGEISSIEERDGEYGVYSTEVAEENKEEENKMDAQQKAKAKVLTLGGFKQAGFSNAFILAFIAGLCLGFIALSIFIP